VIVQQTGLLGLCAQTGHGAAGGRGIGQTGPIALLTGGGTVARRRAAAARGKESQQHNDHDG
jgi:hypothetical protein